MAIRITVTGDLGSGKSTVCNELKEKYNLELFSTGSIQRKIAVEMGISTFALNKYMETHPEIDRLIDGELIKLSESTSDIAIDSRMAWHFVKNTFDVFLTIDETVAAQRIVSDKRGPSEGYINIEHAITLLKGRKESENYRYKSKYGVDCNDVANYDLVLDTTTISPDYVADVIIKQYTKRQENELKPYLLLSPLCLYPTQSIRNTSMQTIDKYCSLVEAGEIIQPVQVILSNGHFYIYDGHHRASAFCRLGKPLIACKIIAQSSELVAHGLTADKYVNGEFELAKAYDWENLNKFRYITYP
ncbi:MAG: cytidylate kinase family protein [Oscillospiraceae bacterium]|jgi:cytidylate kinase|nr:cytidylate kinase family protein [Oscillospiraceae bacterium]